MTSANRSSEPIAYQDDEAFAAPGGDRRRLPGRGAADRPPGGRFGRPRRPPRTGRAPPRSRLRSRRGRPAAGLRSRCWRWAPTSRTRSPWWSAARPSSASTSATCDHYEALPRLPRDGPGPAGDVRGGPGRADRRPRPPPAVRLDRRTPWSSPRGGPWPCSTIAPTSPASSPSGGPSTSGCSAWPSTAPATATTARSGEASSSSASLQDGFERVAHLRAALPARRRRRGARIRCRRRRDSSPGSTDLPDLTAPPFNFPRRYLQARELVAKDLRTFPTTSAGRLFDTAAALLGFTREISFEGQAAIWLEQLARRSPPVAPLPMPFVANELDYPAPARGRRRGSRPRAGTSPRSPAPSTPAWRLGSVRPSRHSARSMESARWSSRAGCSRTSCCWRKYCRLGAGSQSGATARCPRTTAASASARLLWRQRKYSRRLGG